MSKNHSYTYSKRRTAPAVVSIALSLGAIATTAPTPSDAATPAASSTPTWADDFNSFDSTKWEKRLFRDKNSLDGADFPEQVSITGDGHLRLRVGKLPEPQIFWSQPITHAGGYVWSRGKHTVGPGRIDVRAKLLPTGSSTGIWTAIWFRDTTLNGEIDLAEMIGTPNKQPKYYPSDGTGIQQTVYANMGVKSDPYHQRNFTLKSPAAEWHVYTLDWSRSQIIMRIDGVETYRTKDPDIMKAFSGSLDIRFSQFIGENWGSRVGATTGNPTDTFIDYVRYWKAPA